MHDLYVSYNVKELQKEMFRKSHFPRVAMDPQTANTEFVRGKVELVSLAKAEGRIAAEGALPYPPGVLCVVPAKSGEALLNAISWHWKKGLIYYLDLLLNYKACISSRMKMAGTGLTVMS